MTQANERAFEGYIEGATALSEGKRVVLPVYPLVAVQRAIESET